MISWILWIYKANSASEYKTMRREKPLTRVLPSVYGLMTFAKLQRGERQLAPTKLR